MFPELFAASYRVDSSARKKIRLRRFSLALLTAAASGCLPRLSLGNEASATWNGFTGVGGNGGWENAIEWEQNVVPDNTASTTYIVNVDGGKAATSAVSVGLSHTIDLLNISSGDSVNLAASVSLTMVNGGLDLTGGTITATSGLTDSDIIFNGSTNQIVGNGSVILSSMSGTNASLINDSNTLNLPSTITISSPTGGSITGAFDSAAPVSVSGAGSTLIIGGGFVNTGTITANSGTTLNLDSVDNTSGTVVLNSATLNLSGSFTIAQLGTIDRSTDGSAINIFGTLNNAGTTLNLNASTGSWGLQYPGVISAGTISTTGGSQLQVHANGTLEGVTITTESTVDVEDGGYVYITGGLTLGGTLRADATATYSSIIFNDPSPSNNVFSTTTPGNIILNSSGGPAALINAATSGTVVLTSSITVSAPAGGNILGAFNNAGLVSGAGAGSTLLIDGQNPGAFINTGTINASGGSILNLNNFNNSAGTVNVNASTLNLGGTFTTAQLGKITSSGSGSAINIVGTLNNSGATLNLSSSTGSWGIQYPGVISQGTISTTGGSQLQVNANAAMQGVTIASGATVAVQDDGYVYIAGGLTLNGTLSASATSTYSAIYFDDTGVQDVSGTGTITLNSNGSSQASLVNMTATTGVYLSSGLSISAPDGGDISGDFFSSAAISCSGAGNTLEIDSGGAANAEFSNYGSINISSGAQLTGYSIASLSGGSISLSGGASGQLTYLDTYSGGHVTVDNSSLQIGGYWNTAAGGIVTVQNNGIITFTAPATNAGTLNVSGGSVVGLNEPFNTTGQVNVGPSAVFNLGAGTLSVVSGAFNQTGGLTTTASLVVGSNSTSGSVTVGGSGTFNIGTGIHVLAGSTLTIGAGGTLNLLPHTGTYTAGVIATLSVTGKLDLSNNALDVKGLSLTAVNALVQQAYAHGTWSGSGITSSTAAADTTHLTAVGVIQNNQSGSALFTAPGSFEGITPGAGDVLMKYTYYGDTNLDGKVDGSDYSRIDSAVLANKSVPGSATGWFNGDFNYDGVINGSDYTLIDNAFNTQGALLAATIAGPDATATAQIASTSVPEPASLAMISIAGAMLLTRRRLRWR